MHAIALYCVLSVAPMNCDETSAFHYEHIPGESQLAVMCIKNAEAYLAEHGIVAGEGEYIKVRCSHSNFRGHWG